MRRAIIALALWMSLIVLLTIARTLNSINYQLTLLSCLYQADHEMVCNTLKNQIEAEPSTENRTYV